MFRSLLGYPAFGRGRARGLYDRQDSSDRNPWNSDDEEVDEFGRRKKKRKKKAAGAADGKQQANDNAADTGAGGTSGGAADGQPCPKEAAEAGEKGLGAEGRASAWTTQAGAGEVPGASGSSAVPAIAGLLEAGSAGPCSAAGPRVVTPPRGLMPRTVPPPRPSCAASGNAMAATMMAQLGKGNMPRTVAPPLPWSAAVVPHTAAATRSGMAVKLPLRQM